MEIYLIIIGLSVMGYLFGSLNFALLIGQIFYKKDIRLEGSMNAGATNAGRVLGKHAFYIVAILDITKALVAYLIAWLIVNGANVDGIGEIEQYNLPQFAAIGAFLGHLFPLFFKFKGGKGVATGFATLLCLSWFVALITFAIWTTLLILTRVMSLASIIATLLVPIGLFLTDLVEFIEIKPGTNLVVKIFSITIACMIIIKHRKNIIRILNRQEKTLEFAKKKK